MPLITGEIPLTPGKMPHKPGLNARAPVANARILFFLAFGDLSPVCDFCQKGAFYLGAPGSFPGPTGQNAPNPV